MTAEACVMNKLGVALAADSAVTLTQRGGAKVYQSAEKLFLLSTTEPVAAMFYGSASLLGVPWETIIKRYRRLHGRKSYATVGAHAESFRGFLQNDRTLFPRHRQGHEVGIVARSLFSLIRDDVKKELQKLMTVKEELGETQIRRTASKVIREHEGHVRSMKVDSSVPRTIGATIRRTYGREIETAMKTIFEQLPLSRSARQALSHIVSSFYKRQWALEYAGVVVGGFGRREVFPSLVDVQIDTVVANRLKARVRKSLAVTDDNSSDVVPFAQREMVYTFMEGIDPQLEEFMRQSIGTVFQGLPEVFATAVPGLSDQRRAALRKKLADATARMATQLWGEVVDYRRDYHVHPVMSVVSMLPKDELASLAEALVNLTILKRRTSTEAETVGGPIDVAVITKGDGFVWIKRKHYFDASLNPRYMAGLAEGGR